MKALSQTAQFARDIKRMRKRGKDLLKLQAIVHKLVYGDPLPPHFRDHPLHGEWENSRDCHVEPDWILIYTMDDTSLCLERTGTHSDLFG
jgi:mRNA interferase YafQ